MNSSQTYLPDSAASNWLVLIPTEFELQHAKQAIACGFPTEARLCGFGPIIAAARTAQLIQQHRPSAVMLVGIAGTYSERLSIGQAVQFSDVGCYGIGIGSSSAFQGAAEIGWQQWPGDASTQEIGDRIPLGELSDPNFASANHPNFETRANRSLLVTATSAASNHDEVQNRLRVFPDALAEDMEGFGVAAACRLYGIPLTIVRGISNEAGERNKSNWQIPEAMQAAVKLASKIIELES